MRNLSLRLLPSEEPQSTPPSDSAAPRQRLSTEYVSLSDLPTTRIQLHPSIEPSVGGPGGTGGGGAPSLTDAELRRLRRLQDALLGILTGLALAVGCWGCGQLYRGRLCRRLDDGASLLHDVAAEPSWRCLEDAEDHDDAALVRGAPDLTLTGPGREIRRTFEGGWPLINSLLHVAGAVVVLLGIVVTRALAHDVHRHVLWRGALILQMGILLLDAVTLRNWRHGGCSRLAATLTTAEARVSPSLGAGAVVTCEMTAYEGFMFLEGLLLVAVLLVVLLEPVCLRLCCSPSTKSLRDREEEELRQLLWREDHSEHFAFRRL